MNGNPIGRPSKLTAEIQKKICDAIAGGNYRETAAKWAGVGVRTLSRWMRQGRDDPASEYGAFRRAVIEAESAAEIRAVATIVRAGQTDPKLLFQWLERKYADRWGRDSYRIREIEKQLAELVRRLGGEARRGNSTT